MRISAITLLALMFVPTRLVAQSAYTDEIDHPKPLQIDQAKWWRKSYGATKNMFVNV